MNLQLLSYRFHFIRVESLFSSSDFVLRKTLGDVLSDINVTCNIFSVIRLSHEHRLKNEMTDSISYNLTPPLNASRLTEIHKFSGLVVIILCDVTKYTLIFSFFLVFFGEV